ncbi:3-galactosyl-N-acetylglucosaminide 4-alpha-L-fucosyltransferase FUT3-like [Discoglossus pictus]
MASRLFQQNKLILITPTFLILFLISIAWKRSDIFPKVITCKWEKNTLEVEISKVNNVSQTNIYQTEQELIILVWVWPFGEHFPLDRCKREFNISGCQITANRSQYDVADAVVIHHFDIMSNKSSLPPKPRPYFQKWAWFNLEPPMIIQNLHFLDNLFNMTMTFRKDSDIYTPYGFIQPLKKPQNFTIPTKSRLVSWVVSKWYPGAPRNAYYEELKKHITIDVYGRNHKPLGWEEFHQTISQYKFYLAFENSIYKDYITEKLWKNALESWAVPVVLGTPRRNYERFIPGDAFIHVDDFSSPKDLANFLLELDKDDEKYRKYFDWRSHFHVRIDKGWPYYYCKVCKHLREAPNYQFIPSIAKWYLEDSRV